MFVLSLFFPVTDEMTEVPTELAPPVVEKEEREYIKCTVRELYDELDSNPLRAEEIYDKQWVEITGYLGVMDSDGFYFNLDSGDDDFRLLTDFTCNLPNKESKEKLLNYSIGDKLTIIGKIIAVGEIIGYEMKVAEIL